jgi:hypothetical protein
LQRHTQRAVKYRNGSNAVLRDTDAHANVYTYANTDTDSN